MIRMVSKDAREVKKSKIFRKKKSLLPAKALDPDGFMGKFIQILHKAMARHKPCYRARKHVASIPGDFTIASNTLTLTLSKGNTKLNHGVGSEACKKLFTWADGWSAPSVIRQGPCTKGCSPPPWEESDPNFFPSSQCPKGQSAGCSLPCAPGAPRLTARQAPGSQELGDAEAFCP